MSATILHNPVTVLRGVGEKLKLRLAEIGIHSLEDLLFHFPLRYQDRTRLTPIGAALDQRDAVIEVWCSPPQSRWEGAARWWSKWKTLPAC